MCKVIDVIPFPIEAIDELEFIETDAKLEECSFKKNLVRNLVGGLVGDLVGNLLIVIICVVANILDAVIFGCSSESNNNSGEVVFPIECSEIEVVDEELLMIEYPELLRIEYPKVLMIEYPKLLMLEYYNDEESSLNNAMEFEESKTSHTSSLMSKDETRISATHINNEINVIIQSPSMSILSQADNDRRKRLDEFERFLLQVSSCLL